MCAGRRSCGSSLVHQAQAAKFGRQARRWPPIGRTTGWHRCRRTAGPRCDRDRGNHSLMGPPGQLRGIDFLDRLPGRAEPLVDQPAAERALPPTSWPCSQRMAPLPTKYASNGVAGRADAPVIDQAGARVQPARARSGGRLADCVRIDWIAPVDDQWIGLGERKIGQLAHMGVERSGEHFARVSAQ
jgi:hypothetical protein